MSRQPFQYREKGGRRERASRGRALEIGLDGKKF